MSKINIEGNLWTIFYITITLVKVVESELS